MRSKLDLPLLRPAAAVASAGRFAKALASLDAYTNAVSTTVVRPRALALLMPSRSSIGGLGCDARRSISIQQSRGLQPRLHLGGVSPTAAPGALPEATLASGELSKALRDGPHAALVSATHPAAKATSRIADSHATAVERGRVLNRDGGCWGRPWWRYGALSQLTIHKPGTWAELARVGDCATRQSRPVECCQALARREQHSRSGASRVGASAKHPRVAQLAAQQTPVRFQAPPRAATTARAVCRCSIPRAVGLDRILGRALADAHRARRRPRSLVQLFCMSRAQAIDLLCKSKGRPGCPISRPPVRCVLNGFRSDDGRSRVHSASAGDMATGAGERVLFSTPHPYHHYSLQ